MQQLLKDHDNRIDSIVGRVIGSSYDEENSNVPFKAIVSDSHARELIQRGDLNTVSVGAIVESIEEQDGALIPRGIIFKELSLVAVPADQGATFSIALKEAYDSCSSQDDLNKQKGGDTMEETSIITKEEFESYKKSAMEEKEEFSKIIESQTKMLEELLTKKTEVKEVEVEVEEVEEVEEEPVVEEKGYKIVTEGGKYGSLSFRVERW